MFDTFVDNLKKILKSRLLPITFIYLILFGILVNRIFQLQIVEGEHYAEESESKSEKTRILKSTRGNIYDCNNILLASNVLSYSVTFEDTGTILDNDKKNAMILKFIKIIEKNGGSIANEFYIELDKNDKLSFTVEGNALLRFKKDIYYLNTIDELKDEQIEKTAEEIFDYLRYETNTNSPRFRISSSYTTEEALKIMTIRYAMFMNRYSKHLPITVAHNVSEITVAEIKENNADLPGVEILQETHRVYEDSEYFAHMLGYTGLISSEALAELTDSGNENYSAMDQIGKTGLEDEYESYLHGVNGYEKVVVNENGRVTEVTERVEPIAGNDLYLTINSKLQKASYDLLEKKLASILLQNITPNMNYGSKGESAADILIPIYDVYFSLINNNVLDITSLNKEDSTDLERSVNQIFVEKQKSVLGDLDKLLNVNSTVTGNDTTDEMSDYLNYIFSLLETKEVLLKNEIDKKDEQYIAYSNDKISLSKFIKHAISSNWINLEKINVGDEYYSTEELYEKLLDYTFHILKDDSKFNKIIYQYLIYSNKLTGTQICLLLFDQGVLEYNKADIDKLKTSSISAYNFILDKIKNLDITPAQLALEPCSGSIVINDVNTGDVIALVSYPSYDNNKLANSIDPTYFANLANVSYPLMNRPLQQKTAPGSTYKMLSSIASLEEGVVQPGEKILDRTVFDKIDHSPRCWSNRSHGAVDVPNALEVSCNYFFYEMGYRLSTMGGTYSNKNGLAKLKKYATMFGLNKVSGIELIEYEPEISTQDAVRSAIGQGNNNYTPSQLSRYVTTLANNGTSYDLTIVDQIKNLDGKVILNNKAKVIKKVKIKDSTWSLVHEGMYKVVNGSESSISSLFSNLKVKVAGKTGTAQQSKSKPNHALFVSYAPYEKPEISVTVVIPNGYTSGNAASLASEIYEYYFNKESRDQLLNKKISEDENSSPVIND